jgi:hypothetical protein
MSVAERRVAVVWPNGLIASGVDEGDGEFDEADEADDDEWDENEDSDLLFMLLVLLRLLLGCSGALVVGLYCSCMRVLLIWGVKKLLTLNAELLFGVWFKQLCVGVCDWQHLREVM